MSKNGELFLHEQVMLMALNDQRGTSEGKATNSAYALAAAVLSELMLRERIRITDDKQKFVEVINEKPVGDPVLDEWLEKIAVAKRRRRATHWISSIVSTGKTWRRIAEQLCERGILREAEGKILLIFKRKVFPEMDPRPEQHLKAELRRAIEADHLPVKPQLAALIALANASGMLAIYFDRRELKARKARIQEIASGIAIEGATREAIEAAQAAMMAIILATSVASAAANGG